MKYFVFALLSMTLVACGDEPAPGPDPMTCDRMEIADPYLIHYTETSGTCGGTEPQVALFNVDFEELEHPCEIYDVEEDGNGCALDLKMNCEGGNIYASFHHEFKVENGTTIPDEGSASNRVSVSGSIVCESSYSLSYEKQ